jgi:dolichol kinase
VSGALKAAWGLTAFVVVAGVVLWLVTGRAVFAVFLVLGVVTAVGAVVTGRAERTAGTRARSAERKEDRS